MNLEQWSKKQKSDWIDIKTKPFLYLLRLTAFIIFGSIYFVVLSPFFDSLKNTLAGIGFTGLSIIIFSFGFNKLTPESWSLILTGKIINEIDNVNDLLKINVFYLVILICIFFAKQNIEKIRKSPFYLIVRDIFIYLYEYRIKSI